MNCCVLLIRTVKHGLNQNFTYRFGVYEANSGNIENNRYNLECNHSWQVGSFNSKNVERATNDEVQQTRGIEISGYCHSGFLKHFNDSTSANRESNGFFTFIDKVLFFPKFLFHACYIVRKSSNQFEKRCIFLAGRTKSRQILLLDQ